MATYNHNLTLLIIDEDVVSISTLSALFSESFQVEIARDGKTALQSIMLKDVDLVLSAIDTPVISGQELCTFVKDSKLTSHIPIIFLTDNYSEQEEDECLSMGAVDYVDKNVRPSILFSRVSNLMSMVAQQKKLAQVSCTDGLTGLANRMQLDTMINQEWYSAVRGNHPLAVLIIDIDHFKLFNDAFGHLEGDKCLKTIATLIANCKRRERDFAARFGGEEFVLLLPFTDLAGAQSVASDLIDNVRLRKIPAATSASHAMVTVSIGIAAFPTEGQPEFKDATQLITHADSNLFKAKQAGRNQYYAN